MSDLETDNFLLTEKILYLIPIKMYYIHTIVYQSLTLVIRTRLHFYFYCLFLSLYVIIYLKVVLYVSLQNVTILK